MPELAEVETVRRLIDLHLKGETITAVEADAKDPYLFEFASFASSNKALTGARIQGAGRKGKYFWLELNRKPWPIFHLGMTGNIAICTPKKIKPAAKIWEGAQLWSERSVPVKDRLRFRRLQLKTHHGFELAFLDPRRFGRLWLAEDPNLNPRIKALGFDPLLDLPNARGLSVALAKRKMSIKGVLLDQALFAGIGNWLADEILFQANLSPHALGQELSLSQIKRLHDAILKVVHKAVDVGADYERFPKSWLFHHRWGKNKAARTSTGQKIVHETVADRTTAWVPERVLATPKGKSL